MNAVPDEKNKNNFPSGHAATSTRLSALLAAGGVLLSGPAPGVELGELQVASSLGQPLRASIAYALGPNEQLAGYCIFVKSAGPASDLPGVTGASAALQDGRIVLTSRGPLREPMMSLQVTVDCPYTAHLRRDYLLMLSPASRALAADGGATQSERRAGNGASTTVRTGGERRPARAASRPATPVVRGTPYRVQSGDTLSDIAARIPDRTVGLWSAVDALFAANPEAFIGGDRNRLKAGVVLSIPESLSAVQMPGDIAVPREAPASPGVAGTNPDAAPIVTETAVPVPVAAPALEIDRAAPVVTTEPEAEPRVSAGARASSPAVPDAGVGNAPVPVIGNRVSADNVGSGNSLSWLMWLGGAGIAIILGLLLFGRTIRERIGGSPAAEESLRRRTDHGGAPQDHDHIDDLQDTISRAEVFTLDADLGDGSGFDSTPDIDVAQEFNFASSGEYSQALDLTFDENSAQEPDQQPTDMIAPLTQDQSVIVDSEVLPSDDDDGTGYDLSMVVDATKQNFDDADGTTRDLHAIEVTSLDSDSGATGAYTLNEAAGYRLIEQDYEDELTATQILKLQMEDAARELSEQLGEGDAGGNTGDSVTVALTAADDADITQDSMAQDIEGTVEVTSALPTDKLAVNDDLDAPEVTVEMPVDQNDATVEMEPERTGRGRRKSRAS